LRAASRRQAVQRYRACDRSAAGNARLAQADCRHARRHHGQRRGLRRAAVGGGDLTLVNAATGLVVTLNVALVAPAATVTVAGTVTAGYPARGRLARRPPAPAHFSVTVPVAAVPPLTLAGLTLSDETTDDGSTVSDTLCVRPP